MGISLRAQFFYLYPSQKFLLFEADYLITVISWHFSSVYLFSVYGTFLTQFNQNKQHPEREIPVFCEYQQHWRNSCSDQRQTHSKIIMLFIRRQKKSFRCQRQRRDHLQFGLLWYCGNTSVLSPSWSCGKTCPLEMLEALLLIYLDAECNPTCSQIVIIF